MGSCLVKKDKPIEEDTIETIDDPYERNISEENEKFRKLIDLIEYHKSMDNDMIEISSNEQDDDNNNLNDDDESSSYKIKWWNNTPR